MAQIPKTPYNKEIATIENGKDSQFYRLASLNYMREGYLRAKAEAEPLLAVAEAVDNFAKKSQWTGLAMLKNYSNGVTLLMDLHTAIRQYKGKQP